MKKILFNFSNITEFNEQLKLVDILKNNYSDYNIVFLINTYKGNFDYQDIINKITNLGCDYFFEKDIILPKKKLLVSLLYKIPIRIRDIINRKVSFDTFRYLETYFDSKYQLKSYLNFLEKLNPDLLIVSEDGIGSNFHLIRAATNSGIKSMVLPYEYSSVKQLILGAKKRFVYDINNKGLSRDMFYKYFFADQNNFFGFFSKEKVKALVRNNVLPDNVKTVHGGIATKIASESKAMSEHYLKENISLEKIALTGSINDDILFLKLKDKQIKKEELVKKFNLDSDLPLIIFSFVPDYPNNIMFGNYSNYIKTVCDSISGLSNYNCIYQFHPAVSQSHRLLLSDMQVPVSDLPTIELISIADIYMTSYSSTIRWAIAAALPVIHLDLYHFDNDDYKMCKGVKSVNTSNEFKLVIQQLKDNNDLYIELKKKQSMDAEKWGILDGKSGERIVNLIEELCQ